MLLLGQDRTVNYADPRLNLQFEHAANWTLVKPTRKRNSKALPTTTFLVPISGTTHQATLDISRTEFNSPTADWESLQRDVAANLKREIVAQWQQEVLGIPALFTRSAFKESGTPMNSLSGLFYMMGPEKLLLKMTCETDDYAQAQTQLISVLESLRTIDGTTPKPEDPNRKIDPEAKKTVMIATKPVDIGGSGAKKSNLTKGCNFTVESLEFEVRVPAGWTAASEAKGIVFTDAKSGLILRAEPRSVLDSETPEAYLLAKTTAGLDSFATVELREDTSDVSQQKLAVTTVTRYGTDKAGRRTTFDATILGEKIYLVVAYSSSKVEDVKADIAQIRKLLKSIQIVSTK